MSLKSLLIHLSPSLLSPEKYRTFLLLTCIPLLSLFLSLLSWNLEPTVSRDGLLYLELVQVWYDRGSFQAVLEYWPQYWIPPFPLYLMKLLTDCGLPAGGGGCRTQHCHGMLSATDRLRDRHGGRPGNGKSRSVRRC